MLENNQIQIADIIFRLEYYIYIGMDIFTFGDVRFILELLDLDCKYQIEIGLFDLDWKCLIYIESV